MMAAAPQASLPKQCGSWGDLKAAYRLLSNEAVDPQAIQGPHHRQTRQSCVGHAVVLCVQDDTDLDFTQRTKTRGLGMVGNTRARGLMQHTTLAVLPEGGLLGILDQRWFTRVPMPEGETRRERQARWRESQVWSEAVEAVGRPPRGTRFVHVADRASDNFEFLEACSTQGVDFVIRAKHDRRVEGATAKLWDWMAGHPVAGRLTVSVSVQRARPNRAARRAREAQVSVRFGRVQLDIPWNHPGGHGKPKSVYALYAREVYPPSDGDPIDWMLLTNEPICDWESAQRVLRWYERRWVIEEWHRVEKEGCRLEASQLDDVTDLQRLAAILGVIGVRMLQLRDLAGLGGADRWADASGADHADDPKALQGAVPPIWVLMVSQLAKVASRDLTPRQFWLAIAKQGGWLGRKRDGRPGWKVIWRGWYDIHMMVRGAEAHAAATAKPQRCG
jgi:hypothetical protein